jgi:hypothetical protein
MESAYLDCLTLCVASIMLFSGRPEFDMVFGSRVGFLLEHHNTGIVVACAYGRLDTDRLSKVRTVKIDHPSGEASVDDAIASALEGQPRILVVDQNHCPYSPNAVAGDPAWHSLVVTGAAGDQVHIMDPSYRYRGPLTRDQAIVMATRFSETMSVTAEPMVAPAPETLRELLAGNARGMLTGKIALDAADMAYLQQNEATILGVGYEGMRLFREHAKSLDSDPVFRIQRDDHYNAFLGISSNRYWHSVFLERAAAIVPDAERARWIENLQYIAQSWRLCANLMVKARLGRDPGLLERMHARLAGAEELERQVMTEIQEAVG